MGARPRRPSRTRSLLRVVPLAVLAAVTVAAVVARRAPHAVVTTTEATAPRPGPSSKGGETGFDAPLRGPAPPPSAEVAAGAARMLHGDPRRTHRAAARGPRAPSVGWRARVDGPVAAQVTASPDEATLYAATLGGSLVALSRADGARLWSVTLGDRAYATPLVHEDGTIYVGTDAKRLVAISPKGAIVFRLETEGEADTGPTFGKDGAIVFAAGKYVYSARRGGDLAWRFAAKGKVFTAPAVAGDGLVVVGSQDHHVHGLGPGGAPAWTVDLGADVDGGPAIADDGSIYVGTDAGDVVKLDASGHIAWRTAVRGFVRGSLSVARNGDVLAGTYGPVPRVVRLSPAGAVLGAFAVPGTGAREFGIHGAPLEDADGVLFFGAQDDAVYAVGPDGALRWRFETGGDIDAPLTLLSDGSLIVPSEDGTVTLLLP
ncbi:MAG: PQQ-binding-like beta-propeller repeat protein [Labilithrix sp.]|nr:PQQ-binding-like beta-propeller repeat protein [Labilithrix sp.]